MSTSKFFAVAALAVLSTVGAHADEAEGSQFALKFDSTRSRAEVNAEAVVAARTNDPEPYGSRVAALIQSSMERSAVRAEAAQALRQGLIPHGEAN